MARQLRSAVVGWSWWSAAGRCVAVLWLSAPWLIALLAPPSAQAGETLQTGVGAGAWVLETSEPTASSSTEPLSRLTLRRDNLRFRLAAGESADVSDLAASGPIWLAAGTRNTARGIAGEGVGRDLFLIAGHDTEQSEVRLPASSSARSRRSPVLLVSQSAAGADSPSSELVPLAAVGLRGIAWLEGSRPREHEVWFSAFSNRGFEPPERVAAAARGSQLALRGAAQPDHGLFLVWSAFDGQDDEIFFSRQATNEAGSLVWSPPARVAADNTVPDLVPAIAASGREVRLAWSQYDGNDYRLVGSVFRDGSWTEPHLLGGRGSLYPSFLTAGSTQLLLYYEAAPRGWRVLELAARPDLEAVRHASIDTSETERPVLESVDGNRVRVSWPRESLPGDAAEAARSSSGDIVRSAAWQAVPEQR